MQLFKTILMIISAVIVGVAAWLYFTHNQACEEQPWWIVLVLGILNLALIVYLFIRKNNSSSTEEERSQ